VATSPHPHGEVEFQLQRALRVTAERQGRTRERMLRVARAQLRNAASGVVASALDALDVHVLQGQASGARNRRGDQLERMREVLDRDRALAAAALPERRPAPSSAPVAIAAVSTPEPAAAEPAAVVCDEPIRTRSMAKLLAAQGHLERALSIYAYLLAQDGGNPTLHAEVAALRASSSRPC
jgi:hypothetical protein